LALAGRMAAIVASGKTSFNRPSSSRSAPKHARVGGNETNTSASLAFRPCPAAPNMPTNA
jgi:hypothetical protein